MFHVEVSLIKKSIRSFLYRIVGDLTNQGFSDNGFEYSKLSIFSLNFLEICCGALILLLCDGEELCGVIFSWYAYTELEDEFGTKIIQVKVRVKL
jgi:hypothetical protein